MSPVIDQLTDYFAFVDEAQGAVLVEDLDQHALATRPRRTISGVPPRRRVLIALASAIAVLLVVGGVAALVQLGSVDEPRRVATTLPGPDTDEPPATTSESTPTSEPPATTPVSVATPETSSDSAAIAELVWTKSDVVTDWFASVTFTDDRFFIIGLQMLASDDGLAWEPVALDGLAGGLTGTWTDTDARNGKIIHLTVRDGRATAHLFDVRSGTAQASDLSFTATGGHVAISQQGEAVALLWDASDDSPSATTPSAGFWTADGVEWNRVPDDTLPTGQILSVAGLGDGFAVTSIEGSPTRTFWYSSNGAEWSPVEADGPLPVSLVSYGDAALAFHESAFGPQALSANASYVLTEAGGTLLPIDLDPLAEGGSYGPEVGAGGLGIVSFSPVDDGEPETWYAEYSTDGRTWVRQELPFSSVTWGGGTNPAVGADRVVVLADGAIWVGALP